MASLIFTTLLRTIERGAFPRTRKNAWRGFYSLLSLAWRDTDWRFMNYGFVPPGARFDLRPSDEADRPFIGLYQQAVDGLPVAGSRVLEVGSGRGGGSRYIASYHAPRSVVGVDLSPTTVRLAQRLNDGVPGLRFEVGSAERLPLPDQSVDIVVNIESSHCYADVAAFAREVGRVLSPGGWFTFADMRTKAMLADLERQLSADGLRLEERRDLTSGVVAALDAAEIRKRERINRIPFGKRFMAEFAGSKGSLLYRGLASGAVVYVAYRFQKRSPLGDQASAPP